MNRRATSTEQRRGRLVETLAIFKRNSVERGKQGCELPLIPEFVLAKATVENSTRIPQQRGKKFKLRSQFLYVHAMVKIF